MKAWLAVFAGVGTAFLGGVVVGRWTTPVRVIEVAQKLERKEGAKAVAQAQQHQAVEQEKKATRKVKRTIPQPQACGDKGPPLPPVVEEIEEEVSDRKSAVLDTAKLDTREMHLLTKEEKTLKITEAPAQKWHLVGLVGLALSDRQVHSGLVLARDVGPVQLGAWGMRGHGWIAGLSLGVSF